MDSRKELTWRHLRALNELYIFNYTRAKVSSNAYINYLINTRNIIRYKIGNHSVLEALSGYKEFYEKIFKEDFFHYETFLKSVDLETDARRRYDEDDIRSLIFIQENKNELISNLSSIRVFSVNVFKRKGSKYLENHPGLKSAVCKLLSIDDFPEKDPKNLQWRFVIDCLNPKAIILCENIAHLKNPWQARKKDVELWYVGGNNISNIDYISSEKLRNPIFYSCDWDFHGLSIFGRIKEKLRLKTIELNLIFPSNLQDTLPIDSPYHNSLWDKSKNLSGLSPLDFNEKEKTLIHKLIQENRWIEEESNDIFFQLFN